MRHFKPDEFKCKCGCGMDATPELKALMDLAREKSGVPFVITSGARCVAHNSAVGGTGNSAHTRGLAADIKFYDSSRAFKMLDTFFDLGVKRIGYNQKHKFFHVDIDESLPQDVFFNY